MPFGTNPSDMVFLRKTTPMKFSLANSTSRRSTVSSLVIVALTVMFCSTTIAADPKPQHTKDSLEKVRKLLDEEKAVLVDVREKQEWDAGHVEGALLVSLSGLRKDGSDADFVKALNKKLSKKIPLYVHCRSGRRCLMASEILNSLGYETRPLKPGFQQLIDAGFPQAKPRED